MLLAPAVARPVSGRRQLLPIDGRLSVTSAGYVRVEPGPWKMLPPTVTGVRLENLYLKMPDGVRLNAFLYLPYPLQERCPVLVCTLPYRYVPQRDSHVVHHGYASLLVDVRGTGGSQGIPSDEYSHAEHQDTAHIIDWISKQLWCNGNVGMYGASYGAFNSLQQAYEMKPPALKAVFLMCGTDNRYTDDIHYPGGAMLMVDQSWALGMLAMNCMPGAPDYVIDDRAAMDRWNASPWLQGFLHHQTDGPYWRHGSLAPDYSRLTIPTFLVGGYLDIYQNQVPRVMRYARNAETRGILGPWHHSLTVPGPAIDLRGLLVRWFDQWLKGKSSGILGEPRVSFYMPKWRRQSFRFSDDVPGEWRFLHDWPESVFAPGLRLFLRPEPELNRSDSLGRSPAPGSGGRIAEVAGPPSALRLTYLPSSGGGDQSFGPDPVEGYYGLDRRDEDVFGLSFDTSPLVQKLEILGFARGRLYVSSSAPVANWIIRLCDVAADGTSYLVARGYLNGTHRQSHTQPEPLRPGEVYELAIELMCVGYQFEPGHRIRVNISNADFPVLWPSPAPMTTTLYTGSDYPSHVELPVLSALTYLTGSLAPPPADGGRSSEIEMPRAVDESPWYEFRRDREHDVSTAAFNLPLGGKLECRVANSEPGNASMRITTRETGETASRRIQADSEGTLRSTPTEFILEIRTTLTENGKEIRTKEWQDTVKRGLV